MRNLHSIFFLILLTLTSCNEEEAPIVAGYRRISEIKHVTYWLKGYEEIQSASVTVPEGFECRAGKGRVDVMYLFFVNDNTLNSFSVKFILSKGVPQVSFDAISDEALALELIKSEGDNWIVEKDSSF